MKPKLRLLIPIIALAICSCGAAQLNPKASSAPTGAAKLFSIAEHFFQSKSYDKAFTAFQKLLVSYPSDSNGDIVLMRIATIFLYQEKYDLSLITYRRLIVEYPHSELAINAMIEIMMLLHRKDQFKEVILQASKIIEKTDSKNHLSRTYEVLGDTYVSLGSPRDAIFFYHFAYQNSRSPEDKKILLKLKKAVSLISTEETVSLLLRIDDAFLGSYLLYKLGINRYEKKNYNEAAKILSKFIDNFPDHENTKMARAVIEEINQRLAFNRWRIGCLLPLSGAYEKFGKRALSGVRFALDQTNAGHNQPVFEMIVKDTESEPEIAIQSTRQIADEQISIIIGPIITAEQVAQEAQINGIPIITLTQQLNIPELGDYVFRIFLTPQLQIDAILPYAIEQFSLRRFAVLYPEDNYGNTFMKMFMDKALDYGARVVASESYNPDQTDFAAQIRKLSKNQRTGYVDVDVRLQNNGYRGRNRHVKSEVILNFDAIFIPDVPEKIALIAPQLAYYDIDNVLLLGTNLWHSDKLLLMAGEYIQEAIMADVFYSKDSKKNVKEFIVGFEEFAGYSPGFIEALAYDAAMIAFQTAGNPQVESRKDIKDNLQNLSNFEGVTGLTSFKENGDAVKKLYILQVVDNKFIELNGNQGSY